MKKFLVVIFAIATSLSACQPQAGGPQISILDAWGRSSPAAATASAFYMVIRNGGPESDRLLSVTSEACGMTEIHESYLMDNGSMGMRPVEGGLEIPAGGAVELKAGGLHMMCMGKKADFVAGDTYTVVLVFEKSGTIEVEVEIRNQ